ncbi:hypothetical protein [Actinospica robiniae]|uniref:hypothetical protein n=1 Tax=Actinospica robiniae TaxID=304901 RepID=UPI000429F061|nr:hypothetical protein [Actinospica robiniae]
MLRQVADGVLVHESRFCKSNAVVVQGHSGVLLVGDMLSDIFVPMVDMMNAADPTSDYLAALGQLEDVADDVDIVIPGHGSVAGADQVRARIEQDRAYVHDLIKGDVTYDPRNPSRA